MHPEVLKHYYGDTVRTLFIISGLIMIVGYPFFHSYINQPISFAIAGCILLAVVGGLTNPALKWVTFLNMIISIVAFVFFEYYAVDTYFNLLPKSPAGSVPVYFFWANQLLAIFFFFSTYLSTKTFRGSLLAGKD